MPGRGRGVQRRGGRRPPRTPPAKGRKALGTRHVACGCGRRANTGNHGFEPRPWPVRQCHHQVGMGGTSLSPSRGRKCGPPEVRQKPRKPEVCARRLRTWTCGYQRSKDSIAVLRQASRRFAHAVRWHEAPEPTVQEFGRWHHPAGRTDGDNTGGRGWPAAPTAMLRYRVNQATPRRSASSRPSRVTSHSGLSTARRCPPSRCVGRITAPTELRVCTPNRSSGTRT